jgi:hypothetical protein
VHNVPSSVFGRYLQTVANCEVQGAWARRRESDDAADLGRSLMPVSLASPLASPRVRDLR